jgi:high affinity Mn2+ porin
MHVWRGFYPALGFQYVDHPGYNKDRGPVVAPALRFHFEF